MRTITPSNIGYANSIDHLYLSFGDHDLSNMSYEEEVGPFITLQYSWPDEQLAGMEVHGFVEHFGKPPMQFTVNAAEPFAVNTPALKKEAFA